VVHDQHRDAAPAQPKKPLLDRRPAVGVVLAQRRGQARQVVEDEQLDAVEPAVELGLDERRRQVADALLDQVGDDLERGGPGPPVGGHPLQALAQRRRRHFAVDQQHPARPLRVPAQERRSGRHRMSNTKCNMRLAGPARGIEHHQPFLRDDGIEHHAARLDVEREQLREVEWTKAFAEIAAGRVGRRRRSRAAGGIGERRRIGDGRETGRRFGMGCIGASLFKFHQCHDVSR
jgi:hypothetical protein